MFLNRCVKSMTPWSARLGLYLNLGLERPRQEYDLSPFGRAYLCIMGSYSSPWSDVEIGLSCD